MTLARPAYRLQIGSSYVDTAEEPRASTLIDLKLAMGKETPTDELVLVLSNTGGLEATLEDEVILELGYAGQTKQRVFTGTVTEVTTGLTTTRVIAHDAAHALLHATADETFLSKTAGEIIRELASRASVTVAEAESGTRFPAYVVDGRRSLYHHMRDLADLCGMDLSIDPEGRLVAKTFIRGATLHTFEYAKHILALDEVATTGPARAVEVWGESPGGGGAEEAWAWLTKDFGNSRGSSGSGTAAVLERAAVRDRSAADSAARAEENERRRNARRGRVRVQGYPAVTLADSIRLTGLPEDALNGSFAVRAVSHRLSRKTGFVTAIAFRSLS